VKRDPNPRGDFLATRGIKKAASPCGWERRPYATVRCSARGIEVAESSIGRRAPDGVTSNSLKGGSQRRCGARQPLRLSRQVTPSWLVTRSTALPEYAGVASQRSAGARDKTAKRALGGRPRASDCGSIRRRANVWAEARCKPQHNAPRDECNLFSVEFNSSDLARRSLRDGPDMPCPALARRASEGEMR
jgi:hypothetical protein